MIVTPAVDVRGGRCVQLVGGRPDEERVSLPDAVAEARQWHALGFESLHVVDLDAALGTGDNLELVEALLQATPARTQVGGGVRTDERVAALFDAGADRLIVGTRGLDDPAWLSLIAARHPQRIVLAVDTRDGRVLRRGWTEETGSDAIDLLKDLAGLPLGGVLCTDVGREGRMEGIDRGWCHLLVESSPHPVWISGGVTSVDELSYLEDIGATGAVLGMALYTDTLNRREVAARWGGPNGSER